MAAIFMKYFQRAPELVEALPSAAKSDRLEADLRLGLHGFGSQAVEACAHPKALGEHLPGWPGRFAADRLVWSSCLLR
jgi:hypothetical protein